MRRLVCNLMLYACEWSGHAFECYNRPRWANRLLAWSMGL